MDFYTPLRNYCERTGDTLLSEPFNAITNISFLIAAGLLLKSYTASGRRDNPVLTLILIIGLVGVGSTLFHTFANGMTMMADVIPITAFTFYYLWLALRRLLHCKVWLAFAMLVAFAVLSAQTSSLPDAYRFNGSVDYFPCLLALLLISALLSFKRSPGAKPIAFAALLFITSLTFRSIDFMVCPAFPIGTHFLWHLINGVMLYCLTSVFIHRPTTAK